MQENNRKWPQIYTLDNPSFPQVSHFFVLAANIIPSNSRVVLIEIYQTQIKNESF